MSQFSPSDAALEGFRLTRERPLPVLIWSVLRLLYGVGTLVLLFSGRSGQAFTQLMVASKAQPQADPAQLMPLLAQVAPALTLMAAVTLVFYAVTYTAMLRAILRPGDRAFGYLRLSIDEGRQLGLAVIAFALFLIYAFVLEIVSIILVAAAKPLGAAALPAQILVILALVVAFVYPAVRLSLAPAMTFADGRITLFRSLPVTQKQFWPMLGAYLVAFILVVVVSLVADLLFVFGVGAIGAAHHGFASITDLFNVMQPPEGNDLSSFFSPIGVSRLVFSALVGTLASVILFAPAAAIFRELTGRVGAPATHVSKPGQPWG